MLQCCNGSKIWGNFLLILSLFSSICHWTLKALNILRTIPEPFPHLSQNVRKVRPRVFTWRGAAPGFRSPRWSSSPASSPPGPVPYSSWNIFVLVKYFCRIQQNYNFLFIVIRARQVIRSEWRGLDAGILELERPENIIRWRSRICMLGSSCTWNWMNEILSKWSGHIVSHLTYHRTIIQIVDLIFRSAC